jgi:TfoX/Sxy family transcriptional regulator of competence genes|tara:strand:+ start:510 stop:839 length:330 start_codon:yes stop_codon:yes gene_type:complete
MPFDEGVSERVREVLHGNFGIAEQRMFGGLAFSLNGNMVCGVFSDELIVRVGPKAYDEALSREHARLMDFTGRPMKGWVYVAPDGFSEDAELDKWVALGVDLASSLPAK